MTTREQVRELRADGLKYREIAERLEISPGYARRCGSTGTAYESSLRAARDAKRRRIGTCEVCGGPTAYNGHASAVSTSCNPCANRANGEKVRGKGPAIEAVLSLLRGGAPVRFIDMRDALDAAGYQPEGIHNLLYQRLIPYGFARRIARGVYVAGPALTNGSAS